MSDETEPKPRFSLMAKLRVIDSEQPAAEGYVIEHLFRDGRWLYKLSLPNPDRAALSRFARILAPAPRRNTL
jgi:hypothetical protein